MHAHCVRPDLICFVDVPVRVCLARIEQGREGAADLFENQRALTRARASHLVAIERLRDAGDRIEIVDGDADPHAVCERIWKLVEKPLTEQGISDRSH
jgi:thymidylate kinase